MKVLIIGLGSIAKKHIIALRRLHGDDTEIYALRSSESAPAVEGVHNIYSLKETDANFDFAIISNPTNLHFNAIKGLIDLKIPLFIEKPPLSELSNASVLASMIMNGGITSYVACNLRFHPCISYLKKLFQNNADMQVNEVNVYCGSYLPEWRPNTDFRSVYSANAEMGGGVHLDLYHELDYVHWIFGQPETVKSVKTSRSSLEISSVDYANYILQYQHFSTSIILNYYRRDPKRSIEIVFEHITWTVDLLKSTILDSKGNVLYENKNFTIADTYLDQISYFVKCMAENQTPMNTFVESLAILKTCLSNE